MVRLSTVLLIVTSVVTVSAAGGPARVHPHARMNARSHGGSDFNHAAAPRHMHGDRHEVARSEVVPPAPRRRKVLRRAAVDTLDKLASQKKRGDGQGGKVCVIRNSDGTNATTTLAQTASSTASASPSASITVASAVSSVISSTASSTIAPSTAATTSAPAAVTSSSSVWVASSSSYSSSAAQTTAYSSTIDTGAAYLSISLGLGGGGSSSSSSTSSSSAAATTTAASSTSTSSLTPNGNKAGVAGGDSLPWIASELGWWYDWSASPSNSASGSAVSVPMIWGDGTVDATDASRLATFEAITTPPTYIIGFEEPDCAAGSGSAGFGVSTGVTLWDSYVAPLGAEGSLLVSPSMCKQASESGWLGPFEDAITRPWDITNLHINKNSMAGVNEDLDHYWTTYGKPMWITEFACVDDSTGFVPCTDQSEIDQFISDIVTLFEADSRVYAYAYSDGEGLGSVWPTVSNGALSASGQAYLSALQAR